MIGRAVLSAATVAAVLGLAAPAPAQGTFAPPDRQRSQSPPTTRFAPPAAPQTKSAVQAAPAPRKEAARKEQPAGPANALQGFSENKNEPVKIGAATLEVRDKDRVATFNGNVQMTQGDTTLKCASLVVYYEDDAAKSSSMTTASATPGSSQRIRRLEARGNVQVMQKDQLVTGDSGIFDMRANTVTLTGNVVITRGQNIMRGAQRLTVDLTNGVSRMEGGRVEGLFVNDAPPAKSEPNTSQDMLKLPRSPRPNLN